jgi:hypothetical protein
MRLAKRFDDPRRRIKKKKWKQDYFLKVETHKNDLSILCLSPSLALMKIETCRTPKAERKLGSTPIHR